MVEVDRGKTRIPTLRELVPGLLGLLTLALSATTVSAEAAESVPSFTDCADCPEMVPVPTGDFFMGATAQELRAADLPAYFAGREEPLHRVAISEPLAVSRFEVSLAQFARFIDDTGYAPSPGCWIFIGSEWIFDEGRTWRESGLGQDDSHPVTCINWHDAVAYAGWLTRRTGKSYRLLSEAEWEYAARGGTQTAYWFGDSAEDICKYVNLGDLTTRDEFGWHEKDIKFAALNNWTFVPCRDGHATTAPVDFGAPNPFGIYNMLGNVTELTADCWHPDHEKAQPTQAPRQLSGDCAYRVMRGQGWTAIDKSTRSAFRARMLTTDRRFYLGIRLARDLGAGESP